MKFVFTLTIRMAAILVFRAIDLLFSGLHLLSASQISVLSIVYVLIVSVVWIYWTKTKVCEIRHGGSI
jgi:hypothetical protein